MKRYLCLLLGIVLIVSLCSCGNKALTNGGTPKPTKEAEAQTKQDNDADKFPVDAATAAPINDAPAENDAQKTQNNTDTPPSPAPSAPPSTPEPTAPSTPEPTEEPIDDPAWDELEKFGRIQTENGLLYVEITMPADYISSDTTQDSLDENAGENYTSAVLNDDGSVTYKMTKKQHRAMLDSVSETIDNLLHEWVDSPDNSFTEITHNSDYTSFFVHLSTEQLGLYDSIMVLGFYMVGGMYSRISGHEVENIEVNFYSASDVLIETANSSEMQG